MQEQGKKRDIALSRLMLHTGLRVSEVSDVRKPECTPGQGYADVSEERIGAKEDPQSFKEKAPVEVVVLEME